MIRTSAMIKLCYDSLATFLIKEKSYPDSILADFTVEERKMLSKHLIVDFTEFNVKFISGEGKISAMLESIRLNSKSSHKSANFF